MMIGDSKKGENTSFNKDKNTRFNKGENTRFNEGENTNDITLIMIGDSNKRDKASFHKGDDTIFILVSLIQNVQHQNASQCMHRHDQQTPS